MRSTLERTTSSPSHSILVSTVIAGCGHKLIAVSSAKSAKPFLTEGGPDLVILDGLLPDADGATWLKGQRAQGMQLPVLFVSAFRKTARNQQRLKEECGVEDFLAKPTSAPALLAKVERGLKTALEQLRSSPRDCGLQGVARRRAHQIAGTAGSFGFDQIGDSCATLEDALALLQAGFDFAPVAAALDSLRKATA
jgi:DNA-binding response OmpR family regulator